jgi:hypothetical protein
MSKENRSIYLTLPKLAMKKVYYLYLLIFTKNKSHYIKL